MTRRVTRFKTETPAVLAPSPDEAVTRDARKISAIEDAIDKSLAHFGYERDHLLQMAKATGQYVPSEDVASEATHTDAFLIVEHIDESNEWVARWTLADHSGSFVVRSLTLEPVTRQTPAGGITANLLRALKPSAAVETAALVPLGTPDYRDIEDIMSAAIRQAKFERDELGPLPPPEPRRGRPPLSDEHLARVAVAYLREAQNGPGILTRLAEQFDRTEQTMRDQVSAARKTGWLGPAPGPGRKGGGPGPKLLQHRKATGGTTADD